LEITTLPVETYLDTDTMTLKNTTLEQHFQQEVNAIQSDYDKKLIRQNKVTVAGETGWKVEYTLDGKSNILSNITIHLTFLLLLM
jgi:hypothetical protein